MGWLYQHVNRRGLIEQLTADCQNGKKTSRCLAKCFKGVAWKGILWTVVENTIVHSDKVEIYRFIMCTLLDYDKSKDMWGYKDMDESASPYYFNCPEKYLKMVTPETNGKGIDTEWRKGVEQHHIKRKQRLYEKRHMQKV